MPFGDFVASYGVTLDVGVESALINPCPSGDSSPIEDIPEGWQFASPASSRRVKFE